MFEIQIITGKKGALGVALYDKKVKGQNSRVDLVRCHGVPFRAITARVLEAVKAGGYKAQDFKRGRKDPFEIPEATAVRLGLLLMAVKPLRRLSRIEEIDENLGRLSDEEAYYWFAKCRSTETGARAQRALRLLLAEE
jgi:hypothetical protein